MKTLFLCLCLVIAVTLSAQPQCGFPGDTTNDGRADYLDLLPLGLVYGELFEPRPDWSINWLLQCFEPWTSALPATGINSGFSDTNGDGAIDSLDVDILVMNYDSMHNAPAMPPIMPYQPPTAPNIPCAGLFYTFRKDQFDPARFYADVFFQASNTFPGAMAAAMRFTYDPMFVIDDSTRVVFDPADTDLMGVGAAFRSTTVQRQLPPGVVEMAVSGRAQNTLMVPRQLGTVSFVITEDVIIRNDTVPFSLVFDHSLIINNSEFAICHNTLVDTLKLILTATSTAASPGLKLYPNPTQGYLYLDAPETMVVKSFVVYDALGRQVLRREGNTRVWELEPLDAGWYRVVVYGDAEIFRQLVFIRKPN